MSCVEIVDSDTEEALEIQLMATLHSEMRDGKRLYKIQRTWQDKYWEVWVTKRQYAEFCVSGDRFDKSWPLELWPHWKVIPFKS